MSKATETERKEAIERLREWIKPGDTIYTVLRHVSPSGMTRWIDLYKLETDGTPRWLSPLAGRAMGTATFDRKRESLKVGGCGMDMGYHLVYNLSYVLFPEFRCIGLGEGFSADCPSNDHSNERGQPNYTVGRLHSDGGYALRHRWL